MRIAVLSKSAEIPSTALLLAAIERSGHQPLLLEILRGSLAMRAGQVFVRFLGVSLDDVPVVIPRVGSYLPELGLALLGALERRGVATPNTSDAMRCARNKRAALERLCAAALPTPATVYVKDFDQLDDAIEQVGGPPFIIKPVIGTQGRGVERLESWPAARSFVRGLLGRNEEILIQEHIALQQPSDLRLFVVGDRVTAAMRRRAAPGRVQANLHRGGRAERFDPPADWQALACRAARATGLGIAGVDLIESARGPLILEVNPAPGLVGISEASRIDVAAAIIELATRSTVTVRSQ